MHPSGITEWAAVLAGVPLALAGVVVVGLALLRDRARGRARCPRCWYELTPMVGGALPEPASFAGVVCPECGRSVVRARRLYRTRRHWRWAGVGVLVLGVGAWLAAWPWARGGEWRRWLPDTALIVLLPLVDDDWVERELTHRVLSARDDAEIDLGILRDADPFWGWQWRLLVSRVEAMDDHPQMRRRKVMALIAHSREPEIATRVLIEWLGDPDPAVRHFAAWAIKANRHRLSEDERSACVAALERAKGLPLPARQPDNAAELALASFALPPADPGAMTAPLTPGSIARLLEGGNSATFAAVCRRLGIDHRVLTWAFNGESGPYQVKRMDAEFDGRAGMDCVLLIGPQGGVHWQGLVFGARGGEVQFLGPLKLLNNVGRDPEVRAETGPGGRVWLVARVGGGAKTPQFSHQTFSDIWVDATGGTLRAVLRATVEMERYDEAMPPAGRPVNARVTTGAPRVMDEAGRLVVEYDTTARFEAGFSVEWEGKPGAELARAAGALFEVRATARCVEGRGGPIGGGAAWEEGGALFHATGSTPAEFVGAYRAELLKLAKGGTEEQRAWLRLFLAGCARTKEVEEVEGALGAREEK
ncbi:MAG: hypothetical protein WD749_00015 [Phycisphaerales bacterium]